MDIKVAGNISVYQNTIKTTKAGEKPAAVSRSAEVRGRSDEIVISAGGQKQKEAAQAAEMIYQEMGKAAKTGRLEELKRQIQEGTYQVSPEAVAEKMLKGL